MLGEKPKELMKVSIACGDFCDLSDLVLCTPALEAVNVLYYQA